MLLQGQSQLSRARVVHGVRARYVLFAWVPIVAA